MSNVESIRGQTAIVGIGDTEVGKVPHRSATGLCIDAAMRALADAGIGKDAVDGLVTCNSMAEPHMYHAEAMAEYLGICPDYCVSAGAGGGTTFTVLYQAALAIRAGLCNTVLISMADSLRTGLSREQAMVMQSSSGHPQFETPYGATVPGYYALIARAYMHRYGATLEHLAAVAVNARHHAVLHPGAQMRTPLTVGGCHGEPAHCRPAAPARLFPGLRRGRCGGADVGGTARLTIRTRRCICWAPARVTATSTSARPGT